MNMNMKHRLALATALFGAASLAQAQFTMPPPVPQLPWYIGAGVGSGHLGRSAGDLSGLDNAQLDNSDTTYTVRAGWRFSPYGAVEAGYYDLGRYDFTGTAAGIRPSVPVNGSGKAKSYGVSLVGIIPINAFDIYGRIGYAHSDLKFNANAPISVGVANQNDTENGAMYGAGVRWTFARNWGLFAEWTKMDRIRVDSYTGGVDFRF